MYTFLLCVLVSLCSVLLYVKAKKFLDSRNIPLASLGTLVYYPYDLVVFKNPDIKTYGQLEGLYNIGIVVGMVLDKPGSTLKKVKVLRFNMSAVDKPVVKDYLPDEIQLIDSPLNAIAMNSVLSQMTDNPQGFEEYENNELTGRVLTELDDNEDALKDINEAFEELTKSKKKLVH